MDRLFSFFRDQLLHVQPAVAASDCEPKLSLIAHAVMSAEVVDEKNALCFFATAMSKRMPFAIIRSVRHEESLLLFTQLHWKDHARNTHGITP
jgi:hypothetical protein